MKKITLLFGLVAFSTIVRAQNGLEQIIVEKYYVSNAVDAAGSAGTLPVGSVTYRVYADMLPGYKFQAMYGDGSHPLKVATSTSFFNNEDRGEKLGEQILNMHLLKNSVALDSWFSVGAASEGQFGVLKTEDDGLENLLPISTNVMLKNTTPYMGIALNVQDGIMSTADYPEAVTLAGISTQLNIFDATSQQGNSFEVTNGAISAMNGAKGPTAENRVLLGQFTTDGDFSFELNIQIGTPTPGVSQKYVAKNPTGTEISIPTLILVPNVAPSITISAATTANVGDVVTIGATASDVDGTIDQVEFFVDNVSIGTDLISPYSFDWTAVAGAHDFKAVATDNSGATKTSSISSITVNVVGNNAPSITLTAPTTAVKNEVVVLSATAADTDGTITQVEFFVDNVSVGVDVISPYSVNWTAVTGSHAFKAIATDNSSGTTTSSIINVTVTDPSVGINELNSTDKFVSVFPNPATSELNITIKNAKVSNDNFYILNDYKGALVFKGEFGQIANEHTETIDISTLPSGVYFLTVSLAGEKTIKKISVQ